MFDLGPSEILLLMILALILFGPSKLPELGRSLGEALREFREASQGRPAQTSPVTQERPGVGEKTVRDLARDLGIDTSGKSGEEIERLIRDLIKGR